MKKILSFLIAFITLTTPVYANNINSARWAIESIENSISIGLVPVELQSNYTNKITRAEFCQLAIQTYSVKTDTTLDLNVKSPFIDVDNPYITLAYNMKIVSGVGNNKFAPNNNITRQEAAVMLNNLAVLLGISPTASTEKFVDESYFADWAKSSIYAISSLKSGNTYVMTGTGNNKFSPWMNFTREQAISAMLRLYNIDITNFQVPNTNDYTITKTVIDEKKEYYTLLNSNNEVVINNAAFIHYIGDNKFYTGFITDNSAYFLEADYYALISIDGNYIIPKTSNELIYIGYGKFVENISDAFRVSKVYDINGNVLDLSYDFIDEYSNMGLQDFFYAKIYKEVYSYSTICEALNNGLVPTNYYYYQTQFHWNITREQLCDYIVNLYSKLGYDTESIAINKTFSDTDSNTVNILYNLGIIEPYDNNNFYPYADVTTKEAKQIFKRFMALIHKSEIFSDVFETNYSEYYPVEQAIITIKNIYNYIKF